MSQSWYRIVIAGFILVAAGVGIAFAVGANTSPHPTMSFTPRAPTGPVYTRPDAATLARLPDANYDAVIPGLLDAATAVGLPLPVETFTLKAELTPLYGADRSGAPVATLSFLNFLGSRTVVVPVLLNDSEWTEILTPIFFFNDTATTEIYTLSLHDALPIWKLESDPDIVRLGAPDDLVQQRKRSEEHTSELQSRQYLVCRLLLEKKKN